MTPILAITMGDPAGIGPEIIAKFFAARPSQRAIVIGDAAILRRAIAILGLNIHIHSIARVVEARFSPGEIDLIQIGHVPDDLPFGQISAVAGRASFDYVMAAIRLARSGEIAGIVTAPLAKEAMKAAGLSYPGHTEILTEFSGTQDFAMMLANDELKVILVTIHVSLRQAIDMVTQSRVLNTIRLAAQACHAYGIVHPRIAVAGLNPHAGEAGMFGHEDMDEIAPAIAKANAEGLEASGPWPGDTVFMRARRGECVLAGVASFGTRPTVDDGPPLLEVFLFDFSGDLYGEILEVEFVAFIRDELKFDGLEALVSRMQADVDEAKAALAAQAR